MAAAALLALLAGASVPPRALCAEPAPAHGPVALPAVAGAQAPRHRDAAPRHHTPQSNVCTDCHLAAGRPPAAEDGEGLAAVSASFASGNPAFLRTSDPLDLCLSCHDGQPGIPDVLGADENRLKDRSAGFFGTPDLPSRRGHGLAHGLAGGTAGRPRDRGMLTCIDCHDPHGSGAARNLRRPGRPGDTPGLGLFVDPSAVGMGRYESASVSYGTLDSDELREVSSLCTDCHADFSGPRGQDPDGDGRCDRHPSYDSERGSPNHVGQGDERGTTDGAHWERGEGSGFEGAARARVVVRGATRFASGRTASASRDGVFCLSCHKAHGSSEPFGLVWPAGRGVTSAGCDQCHNVAGEAPSSLAGGLRAWPAGGGSGGSPPPGDAAAR